VRADRRRHFVAHRPECHADAIPAKVTETAERLKSRLHADVLSEKTLRRHEAELRGDAFDFADGGAVIKLASQGGQPFAVHEHDPVHELHPRLFTGLDDLAHLVRIDPAWLFAEDVFPGGSGGEDEFLAQAGREGDVERIDVIGVDYCLVARDGTRRGMMGNLRLILRDVGGGPIGGAARDGDETPISAMADCLPVFPGDPGSAENTPAAWCFSHGNKRRVKTGETSEASLSALSGVFLTGTY